jgi:hypothetical protein
MKSAEMGLAADLAFTRARRISPNGPCGWGWPENPTGPQVNAVPFMEPRSLAAQAYHRGHATTDYDGHGLRFRRDVDDFAFHLGILGPTSYVLNIHRCHKWAQQACR